MLLCKATINPEPTEKQKFNLSGGERKEKTVAASYRTEVSPSQYHVHVYTLASMNAHIYSLLIPALSVFTLGSSLAVL